MSDVFISYARKEQKWAKAIARVLRKNGVSVWWDKRELLCGDKFDAVIQKAIENSRGVIVLWSKLSVKSEYVNKEANLANHLNKLLPVIISNITDKDLPERFRGIHTISLRKWRGSSQSVHVRNLVNAIEKLPPPGAARDTFVEEKSRATSSSIATGPVAIKNVSRQSAVDQERKADQAADTVIDVLVYGAVLGWFAFVGLHYDCFTGQNAFACFIRHPSAGVALFAALARLWQRTRRG